MLGLFFEKCEVDAIAADNWFIYLLIFMYSRQTEFEFLLDGKCIKFQLSRGRLHLQNVQREIRSYSLRNGYGQTRTNA